MNTPEVSSGANALMGLARLATKAITFLPTPSLKALFKAVKDEERGNQNDVSSGSPACRLFLLSRRSTLRRRADRCPRTQIDGSTGIQPHRLKAWHQDYRAAGEAYRLSFGVGYRPRQPGRPPKRALGAPRSLISGRVP